MPVGNLAHLTRLAREVAGGRQTPGIGPRRQLKQDRASFIAQQRQPVFQQFEAVDGIFRKALPVRDELGRLPCIHEIVSGLIAPAIDRLRRRRSIEDAVQLGCRKPAGIILQLILADLLEKTVRARNRSASATSRSKLAPFNQASSPP